MTTPSRRTYLLACIRMYIIDAWSVSFNSTLDIFYPELPREFAPMMPTQCIVLTTAEGASAKGWTPDYTRSVDIKAYHKTSDGASDFAEDLIDVLSDMQNVVNRYGLIYSSALTLGPVFYQDNQEEGGWPVISNIYDVQFAIRL